MAVTEPVIVVVDGDRERLGALDAALRRRFGADYRVVGAGTPAGALGTLARLGDDGDRVALVVADQWLPGTTGVELLAGVHDRHPAALPDPQLRASRAASAAGSWRPASAVGEGATAIQLVHQDLGER